MELRQRREDEGVAEGRREVTEGCREIQKVAHQFHKRGKAEGRNLGEGNRGCRFLVMVEIRARLDELWR